MIEAVKISPDHPILIDKFLEAAIEVDVDCVSDGQQCLIAGIMEHIEEAGIHSGDSACVIPSYSLDKKILNTIKEYTFALAKDLNVIGLNRIYVTPEGSKAPISSPKKILGSVRGGGVIFGANENEGRAAITEGVETAIAVYVSTGLPTIATLSAGNMRNLEIGFIYREIYIFADKDPSGIGESAANELARKADKLGIRVKVLIPKKTKKQNGDLI
jgi:hypothetical protein